MLPSPCWILSIAHGSIVQALEYLRKDIHRLAHFSHMITKDLLWTRYLQMGIYIWHNYLHTLPNPRCSSTYPSSRSYTRNCSIMFFSKSLTSIYISQAIYPSTPSWQWGVPTDVQCTGRNCLPTVFQGHSEWHITHNRVIRVKVFYIVTVLFKRMANIFTYFYNFIKYAF